MAETNQLVAEKLDGLWHVQPHADRNKPGAALLERAFVFSNFSEAFAFMTRTAMAAEKADHHPDWSNVYNKVDVKLSTHDAGGVTPMDIALARHMNKFFVTTTSVAASSTTSQ